MKTLAKLIMNYSKDPDVGNVLIVSNNPARLRLIADKNSDGTWTAKPMSEWDASYWAA